MSNKKTYGSIKELELMLVLYPNQRKEIIEEAGKKFKLNGQDAFFVVAEDGNCALFDKDLKIDDLSKVKEITVEMIREDIKSINIPNNVSVIQRNAFEDCHQLIDVNVPDSTCIIEFNAFGSCYFLKNINISNSVISIGDYAFFECESLTNIIIPGYVKKIGQNTFFNCASLKSITILGSIETIGKHAFTGCNSLESISIPYSVKEIGYHALYECESLKEVIFKGKSFEEVESMDFYPWGVEDESIIRCKA